ncbi:MAG: DNA mismatch repair protein MutS [Treponema sp.]|nr:DNA mismatch repair protein MutS [Treponema sp.]
MDKAQELTPVMQQYVSIKKEHKNEVVFFRLGDFYEMFMEDAVEVSRLLNLTLTHRGNQPMCGIPFHASKVYIARLLRLGKKIVICEQIGDPKAKGLTERKVVEIITPGTACEDEYLDGNVNNYLASLCVVKQKAAFSYIDVTTSSFYATSWPAAKMEENFSKELGRACPREILLPQSLKNNSTIIAALEEYPELSISWYPDWDFNIESGYKKLCTQFKTINLQSFSLNQDDAELAPAGFLLDYLEKTTNSVVPHVSSIKVYHDYNYLIIDDSSRRNLEIVSNLRDFSSQFTLLECVNYACTAMGSRMVRKNLLFPLTNKAEIDARLDNVNLFTENRYLLNSVREKLSKILDIERLTGRIAMDRAHPKDIQALRASLENWLSVRDEIDEYNLAVMDNQEAVQIIELIQNSILEDPATSLTEGRIIKEGWSEELDKWRNIRDNFSQILSEYEEEIRESTGIQNLKIKYNNASGYFIEVSKGKLSFVPSDFIQRRTLVNGDRYTTARLQELEKELNEAGTKIYELERDLFIEIRNRLKLQVPYLMDTANEIALCDTSQSFAQAALLHNWVRPEISEDKSLEIKGGRHPVVENHIPNGEFVPNDLSISSDDDSQASFCLITGPNMAGKSTFLRQNALIVLLAQVGSYVPASSCRVGITDRIFCRVGASDNLARGESTFLVEMSETANILRSSTDRSLVIMDEVGRGTSTEDGLSIAWAVSEHLLNKIKCRTLFATHYHELTRLENSNLRFLYMDVLEENGSVVFLRKVREGSSENSYGIHVACLAGLPEEVTNRARQILEHIQSVAENRPVLSDIPEYKEEKPVFNTPGLFSDEEIILDEILSADIDNMTPMEALKTIGRWKKELSGQ